MGQHHYEGKEFPSYVPITSYSDYDLEKRRPDVIYIHNPYDDRNFVTSVDSAYYSSELKKYTDLLVYIPYYSTAGGMSEAQASCPAYYRNIPSSLASSLSTLPVVPADYYIYAQSCRIWESPTAATFHAEAPDRRTYGIFLPV